MLYHRTTAEKHEDGVSFEEPQFSWKENNLHVLFSKSLILLAYLHFLL
jgi:hypothetical protein